MKLRIAVLIHSREVRYDDAPSLAIRHRSPGRINYFHQYVTLSHVEIAGLTLAGDCKETEFG